MEGNTSGGLNSVGGVTEKQLRWSQWWVDHKDRVRTVSVGVFIFVDVLLVGYGVWGFIDWMLVSGVGEQQAIRQMTLPEYGRHQGVALEEVQIGAAFVLPGGTGKLDLLVPVENHNRMYWAELDYRFIAGGTEMPLRRAFILPNQAKYLTELGAPSEAGGSVEVRIERRQWHRVDLHGAESSEVFSDTRLGGIRAENPVYIPSDPLATAPVSSAKFTLVNGTAFSYYDVDLTVLLYRSDAVVGLNRLRIDRLLAGEQKPMEMFWYQILPQVTKVEVIPDINIYDESVYRAPGA